MAEDAIEIPVIATDQFSQVFADANTGMDSLDDSQGRLEESSSGLEKANQKTGGSLTELSSAISIVKQGLQIAGEVYDATISKTLEYADSVRILVEMSKTSAEDSSRLIQVFDDFGMSASTLTPIIKAMTKEGLSPTIESMAMLSDQYKAIQDPVKQAEFLFKNFGRAGDDLAEAMSKGGDALLKMNDAVDKNLILNQKALDDARAQQIALDNWGEAWEGVTTQLSIKALPVLTQLINHQMDLTRAHELAIEAGVNLGATNADNYNHFVDLAVAEREATDGLILQGEAVGMLDQMYADANQTITDYTSILASQNEVNMANLSTMTDFQGIADAYNEKQADLMATGDELLAKKQSLIAQGYLPESDAILDINSKLADNNQAMEDNAAIAEEATKRKIAAMIESKLTADGALSDGELAALLEVEQQFGLMSAEAVTATKQVNDAVNQYMQTGELDTFTGAISSATDALLGLPETKNVTLNLITTVNGEEAGAEDIFNLLGGVD